MKGHGRGTAPFENIDAYCTHTIAPIVMKFCTGVGLRQRQILTVGFLSVAPHLKGTGGVHVPPTKVGPLNVDHGGRAPDDLKHSMSCRFCQGCLAIWLIVT